MVGYSALAVGTAFMPRWGVETCTSCANQGPVASANPPLLLSLRVQSIALKAVILFITRALRNMRNTYAPVTSGTGCAVGETRGIGQSNPPVLPSRPGAQLSIRDWPRNDERNAVSVSPQPIPFEAQPPFAPATPLPAQCRHCPRHSTPWQTPPAVSGETASRIWGVPEPRGPLFRIWTACLVFWAPCSHCTRMVALTSAWYRVEYKVILECVGLNRESMCCSGPADVNRAQWLCFAGGCWWLVRF